MNFEEREDQNGIRFSFNVWPNNRLDAVSSSVPIGCLYTPIKQIAGREPLNYEPVRCRNCGAVLNSYAQVDYNTKVWTCPLCSSRNPLPQLYHGITPDCLPMELHSEYTTVEYSMAMTNKVPSVFLFVVDTCSSEKEHQALKDLLLQSVASLPPDSFVGFITFGSIISIHELKFSEFPRSYVFSGNKTYTSADLTKLLSITRPLSGTEIPNPFILPVSEAEAMLNSVIDKMDVDNYPVPKGERPQRCTGAALHIGVSLIESLFPTTGGQIMLFTSGPITKGPGAMATLIRTELIRQHNDIEKGKATLSTSALSFFNDLGKTANERNIVINYLSASFEESGFYEVQPAVLKTGGWVIANESWGEESYSSSIIKFFDSVLSVSGNESTISINTTSNFKVSGCIGIGVSLNRTNEKVSEKAIGNGGTNEWKLGGILPSTTLSFFFDVAASKADPIPAGTYAVIQFCTKYRHIASGSYRLRVTTVALQFADMSMSKHQISQSFDQEAATVLLSRLAIWKTREEDLIDVIHFVDRTLIRFCRCFGTFNKGDASSYSLGPSFSTFPQFLYHFRRSPFMSTFNSSPDLTSSLRHSLLTQDVVSSLFMIQPTLTQFNIDQDPIPVMLDTSSLQKNCVLLLDTFFRVLVWHGNDIASWRNAGYHNQPEYANLKAVLEQPVEEAQALLQERFPTPIFVSCDQDSSLSRYLLTRCNPSTQGYDGLGARGADNLGTDEPSFAKFSQKLKEVAVND